MSKHTHTGVTCESLDGRMHAILRTGQVMDRQTAEHFYAWLERDIHEEDRHEVEQVIHRLLADYPDLLETHSWPEMRELAERNYATE